MYYFFLFYLKGSHQRLHSLVVFNLLSPDYVTLAFGSFNAVDAYFSIAMYCRCVCTPCQCKGQHTWCKSHYILIKGNAIWITLSNLPPSIFIHKFTAGWNHTSCTMFWFWLHCMATERFLKLYSFLCLWREYVQVCEDFDHFTFLYFTLRLWYWLWTVSRMLVGCLPPTLFLHECYTWFVSKTLLVVLHASIAIFLQCIKCVYVHRSHRNAFICNMCCLSLQCVSYVVVMFSRLILKD